MSATLPECDVLCLTSPQYMPIIAINNAIVEDMDEQAKIEWVNSDPSKTFRYDELTQKVTVSWLLDSRLPTKRIEFTNRSFLSLTSPSQIEIENAENYRFDGECIQKADEMGLSGLVSIVQKQVCGRAWGMGGVASALDKTVEGQSSALLQCGQFSRLCTCLPMCRTSSCSG